MSTKATAKEALFKPIKVGNMALSHRVALAPLTRVRADKNHVHTDLALKYYEQRSTTPGTLLITEATVIAPKAGGYANVPGLWNTAQVVAWRKITDMVHSRGSYIYAQLWALGRAAHIEALAADGVSENDYVSASNIRMSGRDVDPRALTVPEIKEYVRLFAEAARNAVAAGFDGVEIHGANGYLPDQFLQDMSNKRTDQYGGSIQNRARFTLEIIQAVAEAIGERRTAIRLSPWNKFQDMGMADPIPTFTHVITTIRDTYPNFAYIHLTESADTPPSADASAVSANDFARAIWGDRPLVTNQGFDRASALHYARTKGDIIAFGKDFIANPDLVRRLKENLPLNAWDGSTFYSVEEPHGYTDYPFYEDATSPLGSSATSTATATSESSTVSELHKQKSLNRRSVLTWFKKAAPSVRA